MTELQQRRRAFRDLHRAGCFALPNPWDVGTARYLQHLGFKAIATTSAGYAFSRGVADGPASLTGSMNMTMADVAALGVRRVSVGGALARAAWGGFVRAATDLATHGKFDGFAGAVPHAELQKLFAG